MGAPDKAAPLDYAGRELDVIREAHPETRLMRGADAKKQALLAALSDPSAAVHFAGHARLDGADPISGELVTAQGPLRLHEIVSSNVQARLVVLSACETFVGRPVAKDLDARDGDEVLSLAESFELAGARAVLATMMRVQDLSAALVMKHFYRKARSLPLAEALRAAEQEVRRLHPHPAWWASFTLLER
jgi:CHAT domain-containing protein